MQETHRGRSSTAFNDRKASTQSASLDWRQAPRANKNRSRMSAHEVHAMLRRLGLIWLALGAVAFAKQNASQPNASQQNADWTRPFAPFHIIGNIYWVGSYDLSTYLITTPQGHILINTGVGDTAQQIKASVEQLGFKITDTKILTATHGHFDHVAGMAGLKRMTNARLLVSEPAK